MKRRIHVLAALLAVLAAVSYSHGTFAADTVQKTDGQSLLGTITKVTSQAVTIESGGRTVNVPANEIAEVRYDSEPETIRSARQLIGDARYEDAKAILSAMSADQLLRPELKQDYHFLGGLCIARIALSGGSTMKADSVAKWAAAFVEQNANSYHYLDACELAGDLSMAVGNTADARQYYQRMAQSPFVNYQMRANIALGRAALADQDLAAAKQAFQTVLDSQQGDALAQREKAAASLGMARCQILEKKPAQAVTTAKTVIKDATAGDTSLLANAYSTLGLAYRAEGKPNDAALAFLHVDLLYFTSRTDHVDALRNLKEVWAELQMPERAAEATKTLRERYNIGSP